MLLSKHLAYFRKSPFRNRVRFGPTSPRARYLASLHPSSPTSGTMGYGLPAAVAAALRFKDRPVVCVSGDGDFLMNGQELATAAARGLDLLVILVDNGSYGTIRMHQERDYPKRVSGTDLANPISPPWPALAAVRPKPSRQPPISSSPSTARWSKKASACSTARSTSSQQPDKDREIAG